MENTCMDAASYWKHVFFSLKQIKAKWIIKLLQLSMSIFLLFYSIFGNCDSMSFLLAYLAANLGPISQPVDVGNFAKPQGNMTFLPPGCLWSHGDAVPQWNPFFQEISSFVSFIKIKNLSWYNWKGIPAAIYAVFPRRASGNSKRFVDQADSDEAKATCWRWVPRILYPQILVNIPYRNQNPVHLKETIHIYFQIPRLPAPKVICSLLLNSDLPLPMPAFPPGKHPPYTHSLQNLLETMA